MQSEKQRHLEPELLTFYLAISLLSSVIYILRHPVIHVLNMNSTFIGDLLLIYLPDLLIFLGCLVPYLIVVLSLLIRAAVFKKKIADSLFVVLFFPLISFFIKGMSLFEIYAEFNLYEFIKQNGSFFSFIFFGPIAILMQRVYEVLFGFLKKILHY